jgi:hypothetical protein
MAIHMPRRADANDMTLGVAPQAGDSTSKSSRIAHRICDSHSVTRSHSFANRNTILSNYELVLEDEVAETVEFEPLPDPLLPPLLLPPFFF